MDALKIASMVLTIIVAAWLVMSIYRFETFDPALMPKYPPPFLTERINRVTSPGYPTYPASPIYLAN